MQVDTCNNVDACGPAGSVSGVGIGLRAPHYQDLLDRRPGIGWLEVHGENYFGAGGAPRTYLLALREHYPVSVHCVGLSIGSTDPLNQAHLSALRELDALLEPGLVSDHLCWGSWGGEFFNDLLPLPYTEEALEHVAARVDQVQNCLGRQMLVENVSSYLKFDHSVIAEWDFLNALAARTGCGLLLDINNIYVNACNHGFDAARFVRAIDGAHVQEMHLAGFAVNEIDGRRILIDHHGARVAPEVWELYASACNHFAGAPTLIEWDTDIPELDVLLEEAATAKDLYARSRTSAADASSESEHPCHAVPA